MVRHDYEFDVEMTCDGCSGAVSRVLKKLEPDGLVVDEVDHTTKKVKVHTESDSPNYESVLEKIKKTGKTVKSGKDNGEDKSV